MRKLIATVGLPASGKSTWAEEEAKRLETTNIKVFISNKDEIRKALATTGWVWSQEAEKDVLKVQNEQVKNAFNSGVEVVIVADTNFGKHQARLQGLAYHCKADFEIKDFTKVPLATCIERDAARPEALRVGEAVIMEMYTNQVLPLANPYIPDTTKNPAIIVDLDGTLALNEGRRSPYDLSKLDLDAVNEPIERIIHMCARAGYVILYTSGRDGSARTATELWLAKHKLPMSTPHMLLMRPPNDNRKDWVVKRELFDQYIRQNYNVKFVLDDRDQVVKMWRDLGLCCLQVNYGAF